MAKPLSNEDEAFLSALESRNSAPEPQDLINAADILPAPAPAGKSEGGLVAGARGLQAAIRGALQGLTFGAAPKLAAAFERSLPSTITDTYNRYFVEEPTADYSTVYARDALRHPIPTAIGGLAAAAGTMRLPIVGAGGLTSKAIPLFGPAAATVPSVALRAGLGGALGGYNYSDAPTPSGRILDALAGGAAAAGTGGVLQGIGRAIAGAPERLLSKQLRSVTGEGVKAGMAAKVGARLAAGIRGEEEPEAAGLATLLARRPELGPPLAGNRPAKAAAAIGSAIDDEMRIAHAFYPQIDAGPAPIRPLDVSVRLNALAQDMKRRGASVLSAKVRDIQKDFLNNYGEQIRPGLYGASETLTIPAETLRKYATDVGNIAYAGDPAGLSKNKQAMRNISAALIGVIEDAARNTPGLKADELRSANQAISKLISMENALTEKAKAIEHGRSPLLTVLKESLHSLPIAGIGALAGHGHGAAGVMVGGLGLPLVQRAATALGSRADYGLAKLVDAARRGVRGSELEAIGKSLGYTPEAAGRVAGFMEEEIRRALRQAPAPAP